jgi:hemolysin III
MKKKFKDNEPTSSLLHFIAALLSIAGLVLLIIFAALKATAWHVIGFSIFGATLILLYFASTIYHFASKSKKAKKVLEKIDHAMIYVLIAGTYTPICLTALRGPLGWSILGVIWGLAALGIVFSTLGGLNKIIETIIYVVMGWIIVFAMFPLLETIQLGGFAWLLLGGVFYTIGAVVYAIDNKFPTKSRWFTLHELFHLLVMAGSFSHFWVMLHYVMII